MEYQEIWNKILSDHEKIEYEFSIGKIYREFWLFFLLFAGVVVVGPVYFVNMKIALIISFLWISGLWFYFIFYLRAANAFSFSNRRIIIHKGWLSTYTVSVDYEDITDVSVDESFFNRIFTRSGHLIVNTAGTHAHEVVLENVDRPYELKKKLEEIRDKVGIIVHHREHNF
jgi:uncharacterized membrane protein YdbT with pleckstrin-like domain